MVNVRQFIFKPSRFFRPSQPNAHRSILQVEENGFMWIINVENQEMYRVKSRSKLSDITGPLYIEITQEEAIAYMAPDAPSVTYGEAW